MGRQRQLDIRYSSRPARGVLCLSTGARNRPPVLLDPRVRPVTAFWLSNGARHHPRVLLDPRVWLAAAFGFQTVRAITHTTY